MKEPPDLMAQLAEAQAAYAQGDYETAARLYEEVAGGFNAVGDVLKAAEMRNNASVAWLQADRADEALRCVEGTPQIFAQAGDEHRRALALGNRAAALEALGQPKEALSVYREAAERLKALGDDENYALVKRRISALQVQMGHRIEAVFSMGEALEHQSRLSARERMLKSLIDLFQRAMGIK
ncbi:MAG: tetratricopeptide repeat protein [Thermanaerothrix sp.]|nr:tetratricopeptide repeat protein [Thermanaerothrix sp.]